MKNFTLLRFFIPLLFFASFSTAQTPLQTATPVQVTRCGTWAAFENNLKNDPVFRAQYERGLQEYQASLEDLKNGRVSGTMRTSALPDSVVIPIVVHIVLPNPNIVTDADVQFFINRLNTDYAGRNADSTNGSSFYSVRGHSKIRFVLAKRTPSGTLTNGIERKVGNVQVALTTYQAVKHTSAGGLDPWDVTQYYNLWVGDAGASGLLGIAPNIGAGNQTETTTSAVGIDGICVDYRGFSSNTCYTFGAFNLARTAVHEIGHNFGLYHINGDASCGDDFKQVIGTCALPSALLAPGDDTPTQTALTSGCPSGSVASGCSAAPNPPGKMYQNYMDYTDDACYSMFTKGQVSRMEYILEFCRPGYLTSQGAVPPTGAVLLDAAPLASVNPGGSEVVGCTSTTYPSVLTAAGCAGTVALQPKFRVVNNGTSTLTSLTVGYRFDNGAANSQTVTVNIPTGGTQVVTLTPPVNAAVGTHTFKFYTSTPNGSTDAVPANDTLVQTLTVNAPSAGSLPVAEGFENTAFPPSPWTVIKVSGTGSTWVRGTPGKNSTGSLYINDYNNGTGNVDDFRSAQYTVSSTDSVVVSFDLAYKYYGSGTTTSFPDTLVILASGDCGVSFTEVYKKWGVNLATAGGVAASYANPAATDWRRESLILPASVLANGKLQVIFRSKARLGNNIFIDNVNIEKVVARDLKVVTLVSPVNNVCASTIAPQVTVTNNGSETINTFTVSYTLNGVAVTPSTVVNTPLAPGASTTVTLATTNVSSGVQTIVVTVSGVSFPSGLAEQEPNNNTITGNFTVVQLRTSIQEGFEAAPTGWTVSNPDGDNTWIIVTPGHNSARSAAIDNFDFNVVGHLDDLRSPFVNVGNYDSLFVSFDVAHHNYPGANDRLQVIAITGCGTTFVPTTYSKAGATLATGGSQTTSFINPLESDWRRETVAIGRSVLGTGNNVLIAFRNTNDYGNNIFIDNVNIVPLFRRDLQVLSINQPASLSCSTSLTPSVTVKNNGTETITGYKVQYSVDNGAPQTATVVTGVSIPRFATATINLSTMTTTVGTHTIKVYSFEPVTANGTGDEYTFNDTLTRSFNVLNTVSAPLVESFVGTAFPPANWTVLNPDGSITWRRNAAGSKNAGSAYVNTYNYASNGQIDDLVTPFVRYNDVDSVKLSFDLAASTYSYPGSTAIPLDTLEILASKDCGATFTSVYKKYGTDLQTINAPNDPQTAEFIPTGPSQWRAENIDLSQFSGSNQIALIFRVTNNFENNIFIDNVNLRTQTLPPQLKQQGYVVYPSTFHNSFGVWHYQTPTNLKFLNVYNSAGQLVWTKQFSGNADRQMTIDLTGKAAGVYMVELGYTDASRNVTEKVVKY